MNELSVMKKELITSIVSTRCLVTDGLAYYYYCPSVASWAQLESKPASDELIERLDINAPVNYEGALMRFYPLLKRVAFPVGRLRRSVCIGTWRLTFTIVFKPSGPSVMFYPHPAAVENVRGPDYERTYMFVTKPIVMPHPYACPVRVDVDMSDEIINTILSPLRDDQKIDFMWRCGKAFVDIITNPCVVILYGPDGKEGKGTLAALISTLFPDSAMWLSEDLVGSKSVWPKEDVVMNLCLKRILVCDECECGDGFSYNNIKRWTSNSPVSSGNRTAILCQTIIAITNKISFCERGAINNSIGRRLVIYDMRKYMGDSKPVEAYMITNVTRLKFLSMCLSVVDAYEDPPTSLPIAIYTIFRKSVNKITAGVVYDVSVPWLYWKSFIVSHA